VVLHFSPTAVKALSSHPYFMPQWLGPEFLAV
jgi:hypothetical protein